LGSIDKPCELHWQVEIATGKSTWRQTRGQTVSAAPVDFNTLILTGTLGGLVTAVFSTRGSRLAIS